MTLSFIVAWKYLRNLLENLPCSQVPAVDCSEAASAVGEPSAPSRSTTSASECSCKDNETGCSTGSQFGMTCEPLTEPLGVERWILSLADSPARILARREKVRDLVARGAVCGRSTRGSLARYSQRSHSWKTSQRSLFGGWIKFSGTLPRWGLMRDGVVYRRKAKVRRIGGTVSGLWPTPGATKANNDVTLQCSGDGREKPNKLGWAVAMMPTPKASDAEKGGRGDLLTIIRGYKTKHAGTLATPTSRDWRSGKASEATHARNSRPLSEQIGGSLNPPWVEWLMGWPLGWTDLEPLETAKFQQWLEQHGNY